MEFLVFRWMNNLIVTVESTINSVFSLTNAQQYSAVVLNAY